MSSQHSYTSTYPSNTPINPGIKEFFEQFYRISDLPGETERYVDQFTGDAEFVIGSRRGRGRDEITTARKAMWTTISTRLHSPQKIFPFGPNATDFTILGTVKFGFRDGREAEVEWAAHARLVEVGEGGWKLGFYQVYLDSAATHANAK